MTEPPHIALPFRIVGTSAATVPQDSEAEILGCVEAILSYRQGQRPDSPDFGAPDQAHEQGGADLAGLADAIERLEPRASDLAASSESDLLGLAERVKLSIGEG